MFPEKHVRVFPETCTRICENTYVFWETDNEVLNAFGKMYNNYVENKHCIPKRYTSKAKEVVLLVNSDCALRKTCAVGVFQKVTYISGLNLI